ncbi:hypothetical protein [Asticcacaulis sp. 201]|uniref:hypothetical protein n=1 Tax=Asticcacaulis sp. 201 TaxID=3028787 RepID=UPI002915F62C|nr:hypothetical protein [Asticcacaulis sp. 201]MDV6331583.1 hypothetical protein [Asticcacaulis sp. 201]
MKYLALGVFLAGMVTTVHAATPVTQTVYEGTIGKSPIVLETLTNGDHGAGQYFYRKHRASISLRLDKGQWSELADGCTYDLAICDVKAHLKLTPTGGGLSGTWTANGKSLPVTLKQVAARKSQAEGEPADPSTLFAMDRGSDVTADPYLFRQLAGETLYGPETRTGYIGYRTATDKDTGIHFIRLTAAPNATALAKVNALLDQRRYEMVSYGLECRATPQSDGPAGGTLGDWDSYESTVTYATDSLLVIQEGGSTYCGGAHPNNSFTYSMYDLRRGEVFDLNRVLKLTHPGKDADGHAAQVNTPEYDALLARLTPESPWFSADVDAECLGPDGAESFGASYSLTFNAKGLVLSLTDLPHVMGACMGDYYVIPYAALKTLWTPEAKLYFPEAR